MSTTKITLPLHRVGEPTVDLPDLFRQLNAGTDRWELTVLRKPGRNHHHTVTVDGKSI